MTRTHRPQLLVLLVLCLGLAACGGTDIGADARSGASTQGDPATTAGQDVAEGAHDPCSPVDPRSLRTRFDDIEPTLAPGPDGSCVISVEGTDVASFTISPFDQAAYDAGVAEMADAPDFLGIEDGEGKVDKDRAVLRVRDSLLVGERLPQGVHGPDRWISAVARAVPGG